MSESVRKIKPNPESYFPKDRPEIFKLLDNCGRFTFSEKMDLLPQGGGTPPTKGKIENIHRLYVLNPSENFTFDGCMRSVLEALGEDPQVYDYNLMMALCGDMFTQMYCKDGESDCLMDNCFLPEIALHAFRNCGYESVFFTPDEIKNHSGKIIDAIKRSILRGAPVISIGVSNISVTKKDGEKVWNGTTPIIDQKVEVPFASMIGGYEDDSLLINVWLEEAAADEDGYVKAVDALTSSKGILIVGNKIEAPTLQDVYRSIVNTIPLYLTLPEMNGYTFAKQAFYDWADNIRSKEILSVADKWNMHFAPAVILYTNTPRADNFIRRVIEVCPDFVLAQRLKPLYQRQCELGGELDRVQGGFSFDTQRFTDNDFCRNLTDVIYQLGDLQDEMLRAFKDESK